MKQRHTATLVGMVALVWALTLVPGCPGKKGRIGQSCGPDTPCDLGACVDERCVISCLASVDCEGGAVCVKGVCVPPTADVVDASGTDVGGEDTSPECATHADCNGVDFDLCSGAKRCQAGRCVVSEPVVCDTSKDTSCSSNVCDPLTGSCTILPINEGATCDDGDRCTINTTCQSGVCKGQPLSCADELPCSTESCDPQKGCVIDLSACTCKVDADCDDKNPCNGVESCDTNTGTCRSDTSVKTCTGESCTFNTDGNSCPDDGNKCTNDVCQDGVCAHLLRVCVDAGKPCTAQSTCNPETGVCDHKSFDPPNGQCDGDRCTLNDKCVGGACVSGSAKVCVDPKAICTTGGICNSSTGQCEFGNFDPANPDKDCDGDLCTVGDSCSGGSCVSGATKSCAVPTDPCKKNGTCDSKTGGCTYGTYTLGQGEDCDNNPCTLNDVCEEGVCKSGTQNPSCQCQSDSDCNALPLFKNDPCNNGHCNTTSHQCEPVPVAYNPQSPVACDDKVACTDAGFCKDGACQTGSVSSSYDGCLIAGVGCVTATTSKSGDKCSICDPARSKTAWSSVVCSANANQCKQNVCTAQNGCVEQNKGSVPCDDGLSCTASSTCQSGSCVPGSPSANTCLIGGSCYNTGDPNPTNKCQVCNPPTNSFIAKDCSSQNDACNIGVCDQQTGVCGKSPQSGSCDGDPYSCTNESCVNGSCVYQSQSCTGCSQCHPLEQKPCSDKTGSICCVKIKVDCALVAQASCNDFVDTGLTDFQICGDKCVEKGLPYGCCPNAKSCRTSPTDSCGCGRCECPAGKSGCSDSKGGVCCLQTGKCEELIASGISWSCEEMEVPCNTGACPFGCCANGSCRTSKTDSCDCSHCGCPAGRKSCQDKDKNFCCVDEAINCQEVASAQCENFGAPTCDTGLCSFGCCADGACKSSREDTCGCTRCTCPAGQKSCKDEPGNWCCVDAQVDCKDVASSSCANFPPGTFKCDKQSCPNGCCPSGECKTSSGDNCDCPAP
ncbi:MAG: hypothetical protein KC609_03280 [Myxococcales bacterium]|nr:hypothetical protein [Myxococcales bacterium]